MPKVSVIVPVYNTEKYLRECLDSIVNQTLKDIEIICVNDGSTDDSLNILNEYAKKDIRFTILDQDNQGAGVARNKGLEIAKGEYIIFFDSDDYMDNKMLETLYELSLQNNSDISVCASKSFNTETKEFEHILNGLRSHLIPKDKNSFKPTDIPEKIFQFCVGWPWDKLYNKDFIKRNNLKFQNLRHSNDTFFVLTSLVLATKISIIDEALVVHRKHNNSLESTRAKKPECFYFAMKKLYEELNKLNLYRIYEQSYINYALVFPTWHINTIKDIDTKEFMKTYYYKLLKLINFSKYRDEKYFYNRKLYRNVKKFYKERKYQKLNMIFSVKNSGKHKVFCFMGIKIKIKKLNKRIKNLKERLKNIEERNHAAKS